MGWTEAFERLQTRVASRAELLDAGATPRLLTTAVRGGRLLRVRRDHYALPGTTRSILQAVRIGGRIGCISALEGAGVFAFDKTFTHAHLDREASRTRHPNHRNRRLTAGERDGVVVHWGELLDRYDGSRWSIGTRDALAQVLRCQHPWHAVASIDNALFLGVIGKTELADIFAHVPGNLQRLRELVDGRAEAGQETVLRLILREAGLDYEIQVTVAGVGRVDFIVEGCLVVEADSRLAHDGWDLHLRDRNRDIDLARLGYMSLRPAYQRTMFAPNDVREAVLHLLGAHRHFRTHL
jgi:hypothetical protein